MLPAAGSDDQWTHELLLGLYIVRTHPELFVDDSVCVGREVTFRNGGGSGRVCKVSNTDADDVGGSGGASTNYRRDAERPTGGDHQDIRADGRIVRADGDHLGGRSRGRVGGLETDYEEATQRATRALLDNTGDDPTITPCAVAIRGGGGGGGGVAGRTRTQRTTAKARRPDKRTRARRTIAKSLTPFVAKASQTPKRPRNGDGCPVSAGDKRELAVLVQRGVVSARHAERAVGMRGDGAGLLYHAKRCTRRVSDEAFERLLQKWRRRLFPAPVPEPTIEVPDPNTLRSLSTNALKREAQLAAIKYRRARGNGTTWQQAVDKTAEEFSHGGRRVTLSAKATARVARKLYADRHASHVAR